MIIQAVEIENQQTWDIAILQRLGDRQTQQDRADYGLVGMPPSCLLVVADGLGGHLAGEKAASVAVKAALESWQERPGTDEVVLRRCIDRAQAGVAQLSETYAPGARTTCVTALLGRNQASWTHLGDSRLYVFRQGDTIYRSKDHSVARLMLESGELSEEEARKGPEQGRLYKSLGPETGQEYQVVNWDLTGDEAVLLCTDGFWVNVSDSEMADAVRAPDLEAALGVLADMAVARAHGESDNVTVCAARLASRARKRAKA